MALPNEPGGFAVNLSTGEVHKRHAQHALGLRRTTALGVLALLQDLEPVQCETCFGPPAKPTRATRTRFTAEPVKVVEPPETRPDEEHPQANGAAVKSAEAEDGEN